MTATITFLALALTTPAAQPEPSAPDVRDTVEKGLKWLAEQQQEDGRWVGRADSLPTTTTALAGLALLMEGSTPRSGTYAANIRKAVEWVEKHAAGSGLLGNAHRTENSRPVPGHAYALLFLACAYDVDDDPQRRDRLRRVLARAVAYSGQSQTARGGWGFLPARDGAGTDDPLTTVEMLHALLAARKAGIEVPEKITDSATEYLVRATAGNGGVGGGSVQPYLTPGAAGALLKEPGPRPAAFTRWLSYLQAIPVQPWPARANANTMLTHLHAARLAFALGETGHARLDPAAKDGGPLRWSAFRAAVFPGIKANQSANGGWLETVPGPVHGSAIALIILQLENDYLPAFSR
jgi:hypothetical protein